MKFEDTVNLGVKGGSEFLCVIGGHMNLKMHRSTREDPEDDFDSCHTCASSTQDYQYPRSVSDSSAKDESRPTEGIFSYLPPSPSQCFFSNFFSLLTRWTKPDNPSRKNVKDAIAAANIAGFV